MRRNSLRELVDIGKFIGVEQRVAKGEEAFGLDGLERGLGFGRSRRAAECQSEGAVNLVGGIGTGILFQARGKVASLFEHEGVIAEREGLQWRGGGKAFGRKVGGIRTIKRGEKFMRRGADDKSINAATGAVNKSFNQYTGQLLKEEYVKNFSWVSTWFERNKIDEERAKDRKSKIGSGDRSERIRTYNFPQGRVTDHRINLTLHKLDEFLEGEVFDEMIESLTLQAQEESLSNL